MEQFEQPARVGGAHALVVESNVVERRLQLGVVRVRPLDHRDLRVGARDTHEDHAELRQEECPQGARQRRAKADVQAARSPPCLGDLRGFVEGRQHLYAVQDRVVDGALRGCAAHRAPEGEAVAPHEVGRNVVDQPRLEEHHTPLERRDGDAAVRVRV